MRSNLYKKFLEILKKFSLVTNKDRKAFFISVAIAFIFWLFVRLSKEYSYHINIPVIWHLAENKAYTDLPPHAVRATLYGEGWDLMYNSLFSKKLNIDVNIGELPSRSIDRTQLKKRLNKIIPSNIGIKEINYDFIQLNFEDKLEKKVPVFPDFDISFVQGHYYRSKVILHPDSVLISGPFSLVSKVDTLYSIKSTYSDIKSEIKEKVKIANPEEGIITISPKETEINIPVEQITEKSFFVPVSIINTKDSVSIFPEKVKVTCVIGLSKFNDIAPNDFEIQVDLAKLQGNDTIKTVPFTLAVKPDSLISVGFSPQTGRITFHY